MAWSIIVTLEAPLPDATVAYAKAKPGKAVARESDRLDSAARRRSVATITSLLSESRETIIAQFKEAGFDPANMRIPPEQWFAAGEGLKTVRALSEHVTANLNDFKQPNPILRDLKAAESLLAAADAAGIRFHLTKISN